MSLSPARAHRLRIEAEMTARSGGHLPVMPGYEQQLMQLAEDRRRLKGVQSTVRKAEIKLGLLPKYGPWVDGILAANGARQDDVLMFVMVWRIDAGDYAGALTLARHALLHGWAMPFGTRNTQTVIAEEMADAAERAALAKEPFTAAWLLDALELTQAHDMPDQSRARLHKAIGGALKEQQPVAALNHFRRALQLHDKCGVKTDISQLDRQLRKAGNG